MAKRKRRAPTWDNLPPELAERIDRLGLVTNGPKVHHLVPAFYLSNWAEGDRIRVTLIDEGISHISNPRKAARESRFYTLESDELPEGVPPLLFESLLSEVEDRAAPVVQQLRTEPEAITIEDKVRMCEFLGCQIVRGVAMRRQIYHFTAEYFRLQFGKLTDEGIRREVERRTGVPPTDDEVAEHREFLDQINAGTARMVPDQASAIGQAADSIHVLGEQLFLRDWVVYETARVLVTTDEPVLPIEGPVVSLDRPELDRRIRRGGFGIAGVVVFPLACDRLLAMVRPDYALVHGVKQGRECSSGSRRLDSIEVAELNAELAAHAYRWVFERPSKHVAGSLPIPESPDRHRTNTYESVDPDDESELIEFLSPNRWDSLREVPPWPVEAWWTFMPPTPPPPRAM